MAVQFKTPGTVLFSPAAKVAMDPACCCGEPCPCCNVGTTTLKRNVTIGGIVGETCVATLSGDHDLTRYETWWHAPPSVCGWGENDGIDWTGTYSVEEFLECNIPGEVNWIAWVVSFPSNGNYVAFSKTIIGDNSYDCSLAVGDFGAPTSWGGSGSCDMSAATFEDNGPA